MTKPSLLARLSALGLAFSLAGIVAGAAPAAAEPPARRAAPPRPRAAVTPARRAAPRKPPVKTYDFTADAIDGDRIQPDGSTIFGLRGARFPSLIDLRGDFLHEITRSADRVP